MTGRAPSRQMPQGRAEPAVAKASRWYRPQLAPLEGRVLGTVVGLTVEASPTILLHPTQRDQPRGVANERIVPVTIEGVIAIKGSITPTVHFQVDDEYGRYQPSGSVPVQPGQPGGYFYTKRIGLILSRARNDPDGRQYVILVTASDGGSSQTAGAIVTVPHTRFLPGAISNAHLERKPHPKLFG